jgi:D-tyrosyl-tRNA(Tyr) deacylase
VRLVLQRVTSASVTVAGETVGEIGQGLLILAGVATDDTEAAARRLAAKVLALRIFGDDERKMNRSLAGVGGSALVVPQFTLLADTKKGNRPSFAGAARPEFAIPVLAAFTGALRAAGVGVAEGRFGAHMDVSLVNDGPVTIILEA